MKFIELDVVKGIKEYIEMSLSELSDCDDEFNNGQRYAYVEALELFQSRLNDGERKDIGLAYSVEEIFPLR